MVFTRKHKGNPVAKYSRKFNKAAVHTDRKKEERKRKSRKNICIWDLENEG